MKRKGTTITLANKLDAYNFFALPPQRLKMLHSGSLVPLTRWDRIKDRVGSTWNWISRKPRCVVAAVDVENGCVTVTTEQWSWRRWRWER